MQGVPAFHPRGLRRSAWATAAQRNDGCPCTASLPEGRQGEHMLTRPTSEADGATQGTCPNTSSTQLEIPSPEDISLTVKIRPVLNSNSPRKDKLKPYHMDVCLWDCSKGCLFKSRLCCMRDTTDQLVEECGRKLQLWHALNRDLLGI